MDSQWHNFLRNLGEWHGHFDALDADGVAVESTASILTLEQGPEERLVQFRLRRFANGDRNGTPSHDMQQDYRSLGRQVVFFDSGTFCKGSLQVAPGTAFGGEFGFVHGDRRHRLVQLHNPDGGFERLVLIREQRAGTDAPEQPRLRLEQLQGRWSGQASTITADWPVASSSDCRFELDGSATQLSGGDGQEMQLTVMDDGGYHLTPRQVSHRAAFAVEAGWLSGPDRLERLIRRYDASGAWLSATQIIASRD